MPSLAQIDAAECSYTDDGQRVLQGALDLLTQRYATGARDRETLLRLAFLEWFSCSEPDFLTGMEDVANSASSTRQPHCADIFDELLHSHDDHEVRFTLGWMMSQFPYCCGAMSEEEALRRGSRLWPDGPQSPEHPHAALFSGRGAYGHYFASILTAGR